MRNTAGPGRTPRRSSTIESWSGSMRLSSVRGPRDAQVDEVDARADEHHVGRNVAQLERHLQRLLGVALADVDEEPQAEGDEQREQLEPGVVQQQPAQRLAEVARPQARRTAVRATSSDQQLLQRAAQRAGVEVARDAPVEHQRDAAVLLGDDDDHRVGLLGEADGGAMAGAERLADVRVGGQRQEAAGGGDAALAHDERAVVDRRGGDEDAAGSAPC